MTDAKYPSNSAIAHFNRYSDEIKLALVRRTIMRIPETTRAVIAGRTTAIIAGFALTPFWFALCVTVALTLVLTIQKVSVANIKANMHTDALNVDQHIKVLSWMGFLRSCVYAVLYIGLSFSPTIFAATTASFFVAGHVYLYATQNTVLPKTLAIGLSPIIIAVMLVAGFQLSQGGELALILAPGFFVISTIMVINRISLGALRLIDSQIQNEAVAKTSELRLQSLMKEASLREELELAVGVGTYEWHLDGDRHVWSKGTFNIYGRPIEDGMPSIEEFVSRIVDADRETFLKKMANAKATGISHPQEFSFLGYDGKLRYISSHGEAIKDENGKTICFRGMAIDHTAQKAVAKTLQENLAKLEKEAALREEMELTAGVGSYEWYFAENRHVWSKGSYEIYGRALDDGIPNYEDFTSRLDKSVRKSFMNDITKATRTGVWAGAEYQFKGYDDVQRYIKCYGNPIKNELGDVIGMRGLVVDHTNQVKASERIAESQMLLNLALIQGNSIVFVDDMASGKMRAFGALDAIGLKADSNFAVTRKALLERLPDADKKILFDAMKQAEISGETVVAEHNILTSTNELVPVSMSLKTEGKPSIGQGRVITISTSIANEVHRRNELSAALEEAKRLSRVKSEFLANMSHEIRTPLNGIIAVTGILSGTKLDKKQKEMLQLVESSGATLCQILNDILDIARVESGKMEITNSVFNLKASLESACDLFAAKANEKGLTLNSNFGKDSDQNYVGDSVRIKQIVSNLLSNAVKFTKRGSVDLELKIEIAPSGQQICRIDVRDTGSGLHEKDIARLFDRFEQVDGSITRQHGGSGLGLSISRDLARLMGGEIEVQSAFGVGSTFTLKVPLPSAKSNDATSKEVANEQSQEETPNNNASILAVDDNATNRKVIELILGHTGFNLTLCDNGQEAVDIFHQEKFDIILMDLQMPVMDGLSATRAIRNFEASNGLEPTPIVAVSANAMAHHISEAIDAGADHFLAKPFRPDTLIAMVENVLCQEQKPLVKSLKKRSKKT